MTEYTIASASFQEGCISQVNRLLAEGWQLYGDLQVTMSYRGGDFEPVVIHYDQAMIK